MPMQGFMSGLMLAGYALQAAAADATADVEYFAGAMAGMVVGHGCEGREEIVNVKKEYYKPCVEKGLPTYNYDDFFYVDLENMCVRFGFICLIPGSEGRGTMVLYFNEVLIYV